MNVEDECSCCGKVLKRQAADGYSGQISGLHITCKGLGDVHGDDCDCILPIGTTCAKKYPKNSLWMIKDNDSYPLYDEVEE